MTSANDNRTTELLPCPFCGGEAHMGVNKQSTVREYFVGCMNCHIRLYKIGYKRFWSEAEAIAAWNTRVDYHGYEHAAIEAWESIKVWNTRAELGRGTCYIVKTPSDSDFSDDWRYRCSECGCNIPVNERDPETGDVINAANYCPNCGKAVER